MKLLVTLIAVQLAVILGCVVYIALRVGTI